MKEYIYSKVMISEVFVYTVYIDIESILIQEMGQYHILIYGYLYAGFGGGGFRVFKGWPPKLSYRSKWVSLRAILGYVITTICH